MALKSFKQSGHRTALVIALAALTLPGIAQADPGDADRRGSHRDRGEPQGDISGGQRHQQREQVVQQSEPAREARAQRSWDGGNGRSAEAAAAPVRQAAPAPAQQGWNGGNRGRSHQGDDANHGNWRDNRRADAVPSQDWRGQDPATTQQRTETHRGGSWGGRADARGDRDASDRNGHSWNGRRDGRDGDYNRDRRHHNDNYRDSQNRWQGHDSWRRDGNRQGYNQDHHRWNNNWRRDNRYNWYSYRSNHRDIFRGGSYYAPYRNYNYRRLSIGFSLDALFFSNRYWIANPWQYRLPDVYGPYRWVRYYDDVLLVDIYSGEVVDVIHDFFW